MAASGSLPESTREALEGRTAGRVAIPSKINRVHVSHKQIKIRTN